MQLKSSGRKADYFLIAIVLILTVGGLAILTSASSDLGKIKFNDSFYYLKHQITNGLLVGIIGFFVAAKISYTRYKKFALPLLLFTLVLLVLVFTGFGVSANNASRWLSIGPVNLQPGELLKLTYIIYVAAWLSNTKMQRGKDMLKGLLPFGLVSGAVAILMVLQPATSTVAILLGAGLVLYFVSGAKLKYVAGIVGVGLAALAFLILITPYRMQRVLTYFNSQSDTQGAGYHINQARIAIGSGRLFGVGYGQSTTKVSYLPEPMDDSIFAVAAEELGFVGAGALLTLFAILTFRLFWLAKNVRDRFGKLLLVGFGCVIALQVIVNIGAISGVLPLTGVPLPFVSNGGTALAVFLTMMGICANISKHA